MVRLPAGGYGFNTTGMEIEGNDDRGVDVQFPWEDHPQREHTVQMTMPAMDVDVTPVTCSNYSAYLSVSGHAPRDPAGWLKNWDHSKSGQPPSIPPGYNDKPVTYLSHDDA